jgi:hypothetical protein
MRALVFWLVAAGCQEPGSGALSGRVVIDGDPDASGVLIRAVGKRSASTRSDAAGSYRFSSLPDGDYTLVLSAEATREDQKVLRAGVQGGEAQVPDVHFTAVGSVSGQVTLAGQPGGGAAVFVDGGSAVAVSDGAGRYTLGKIAAGLVGVEAVLSGYRPGMLAGITVTRGQTAAAPVLDLVPDEAGSYAVAALSGVAHRLDGADSSGTVVTATRGTSQLTTTTAADGSYHFDGISTGIYRLDFAYQGKSESIPQVLALAGSTGQVIDGSLYSLEANPLDLPVARRLTQAQYLALPVDDNRVLIQPGDQSTLQLLELTAGTITPLADDPQIPSPLVLSPDHASVLYLAGVSTNYGTGALRTVALAGGAPSTLSPLAQYPEFSGDGRYVLYQDRYGGDLSSVAAGGGVPISLGAKVQARLQHPDGKRIVYQSCDGACQIRIRTVDGGAPTDLLSAEGTIHLAPDGAHVTAFANRDNYTQTGKLLVAAIDGSGQSQLWDGVISDWTGFSADGRYLAFLTNKSELRLYDLANGGTPKLVAQGVSGFATFAPDGRFFYRRDFSGVTLLGTLVQQPPGAGTETVLGMRVDLQVQLSPDGSHLLFRDQIDAAMNTGRIRVADAAGTVSTLADGAGSALLTADGAYVHYALPGAPNHIMLYSVPIGGGAAVQLGDSYFGAPQESPQGGWIAYPGERGVMSLAPSAGGASRVIGNGALTWVNDRRVLLNLSQQPPPYRHQNGLYLYEVTP